MNVFWILFSFLLTYPIWRFLQFCRRYRRWCTMTKLTTPIAPIHPFWGCFKTLKNQGAFRDCVMKLVQESRAKLGVMWVLCLYPSFVTTHPDTAKVLLKSSEPKPKFTGSVYGVFKPWIGDGLLLSDGKKWERNRRLITPAFHFKVLRPYVKIYHDVAKLFLDKIAETSSGGKSVEIYEPTCLATLDTMLRCACSYKGSIQKEGNNHPYADAIKNIATLSVKRIRNPFLHPAFIFSRTQTGKEFYKHVDYVHKFAEDIIEQRRRELSEDPSLLKKRHLDFLDILITARDEKGEGLSDRDIRDEVDTFLFEGHDTTASAIAWAMYSLGTHPAEQEKVYTEITGLFSGKEELDWDDLQKMPILTMFLRESMRMYSPVPGVLRILTKQTVIDGITFEPGDQLSVSIMALHHHPDIWPDHNEFRPERFLNYGKDDRDPYSFVPFSAGPRNCIGQHFALDEQKVFIAQLVRRFEVSIDQQHKVESTPAVVTRPTHGIKLFFKERH